MRIGIDAHCIGQRKTGNETYTSNLVKQLGLLEPNDTDYVVYVTSKAKGNGALLAGSRNRTKVIRPETPYFRIPIGFALESHAEKLDLFHAQYLLPHHLRCRTVLTVHDVLYERFPEFFPKWDYYRNKIGIPWSCRRADHIITVSESSKRDLIDIYGLDASRVTVTYPGPEDCYRPLDQEEAKESVRTKYGVEGEFILYVGAIQPRKNISRLLSAFAELKRKQRIAQKLVIVGPRAWLTTEAYRAIEDHPAKDEIIVTGYVPKEDLVCFYNAAAVFVYVSICEGFGLPVVEAMACGVPTITSRGSALEEIAGDAAVLADALEVDSIAGAIEKVATSRETQAELRSRGLARSQEFSFARMARQTRNVYERVLG